MTKEQKRQIAEMRKKGLGYIKIGQMLGVSDNTISSYCRRNGLDSDAVSKAMPCKQCGKPIKRASGRKPKKFCSDAKHPSVVRTRGKPFRKREPEMAH